MIETVIAQRVKAARQEKGLSQEALSHLINMNRVTISHIETGRRNQINPETVRKLAKVLDKPEAYFYSIYPSQTSIELPGSLVTAIDQIQTLSSAQQENLGSILAQLVSWYMKTTQNLKQEVVSK